MNNYVLNEWLRYNAEKIDRLPSKFASDYVRRYAYLSWRKWQSLNRLDLNLKLTRRVAGLYLTDKRTDRSSLYIEAGKRAKRYARELEKHGNARISSIVGRFERDGVVVYGNDQKAQILRVTATRWNYLQIKKIIGRAKEAIALLWGVDKYISNMQYQYQKKNHNENIAMLNNRSAVNANNDTAVSLLDCAMTSIQGRMSRFLNWSDGMSAYSLKHGHSCVMLTITCPARFHPNSKNYDGSTPRDGKRYLMELYNRGNANFKRKGIFPYGVSVTEPHKDGCPHMHILLFHEKNKLLQLIDIMKRLSLAENPNEAGANRYRFDYKMMRIDTNTAIAGYLFKYLYKSLGGVEYGDGKETEYDVISAYSGILTKHKAWAKQHGIVQALLVGGASVGVWDAMRAIDSEIPNEEMEAIRQACIDGDFLKYFELQGGHRKIKKNHTVTIARGVAKDNLYQEQTTKPIGLSCGDYIYYTHKEQWSLKNTNSVKLQAKLYNDDHDYYNDDDDYLDSQDVDYSDDFDSDQDIEYSDDFIGSQDVDYSDDYLDSQDVEYSDDFLDSQDIDYFLDDSDDCLIDYV